MCPPRLHRSITRVSWILGITALLLFSSSASAQAKLFAYDRPTTSGVFNDLVTAEVWGDVDRDGDDDGLFAGFYKGIRLLRNDGTGTLTVAGPVLAKHQPYYYYDSRSLALADLDYDGDLDLIAGVQPYRSAPAVRFWENDGKGGFTVSRRFVVRGGLGAGPMAHSIAVGDAGSRGFVG